MYTYQDLLELGDNAAERMDFVRQVINQHKASRTYKTAMTAGEYAAHRNPTIAAYQKLLYTVSGKAVPDYWSANYKLASNFFKRFVTQQNQFLLGNGVTWNNKATEDKLGKDFDTRLQEAGKYALVHGVSFGFFNLDHVEVFSVLEFAPLYDEENGALAAGVRFWQVDSSKPLRATLYELDGYTEYLWKDGVGQMLAERQPYKVIDRHTDVDDYHIYDGENYPAFPIVPMYGNPERQSEIVGIREQIDAYDLIKSGFANDLDDVSQIYWTVSNAGGMDDIDLAEFVQRIKTVKAASLGDGQTAEAHAISIPYDARNAILDRLKKDMYLDYMALDTEEIAGGAVTATQIKAAYEPMSNKADEYEYCVIEFVRGILAVAGLDDEPSFTRSFIVNTSEEIQTLIQAGEYLDGEYITEKVLTKLGDADKVQDVLKRMSEEEIDRTAAEGTEGETNE